MLWEGPYKLRDLLDRVGGADPTMFRETLGLYVFSLTPWQQEPTDLLYLGSAHATAYRDLRQRIGEQVACALGFHGIVAGWGIGGIHLSEYCRANEIKPLDLYLGWLVLPTNDFCPVPAEQELFDRHYLKLSPLLLNRQRPAVCGRCKDIPEARKSQV